ncbi:OstA-like protein [Gillisia sp. CAL575]|uniref:OstA-like protein n=1 Tax=Gillisia sp. CAL575 TaxID=985255 RepID=UPI00039D221A
MKKSTHYIVSLLLFLCCIGNFYAQTSKKIDYTSDRTLKDEKKYPGAIILSKVTNQVHFIHEGIEIWCDQAIHYDEANFFKAYGNVRMQQGDTVTMQSKYAEYNGTTQFAFASGDVKMSRPQSSIETDTLFFDRVKQQAYYRSGGTVRDTASVLTSRIGRYYMDQDKYSFLSDVKVTNPKYTINSQQLDFYSDSGYAYLYGPTTIESETSTVYCERGFYDTRGDVGYFVKNSRIDYENRILEGDSLYFNRAKSFASGTNNIKVTDTLNHSLITGHYAEVYREKDSVFITKRALAATIQDNDSIFIHSDTLMITGKPENRIVRGFYNVKLFKSDLSGKSDSIYVNQKKGITKLLNIGSGPLTSVTKKRTPVIWSDNNQMTGDTIHILNNPVTEQLDSLKVFYDAFLIQKDSIEGYNQVKGKELTGLFVNNELYQVDIIKNTETIYYSRNEEKELLGINKTLSSSIKILFENKTIRDIYYYKQVDGTLTPPEDFPPNARELPGFNWRGEEQLLQKSDLFKGEDPPKLTKIKGIPLPEEQEDFFDESNGEPTLLNENSRLTPDDLKDTKVDSLGVPIKKVDSLLIDKKKILEKKKKSETETNKN